MMEPGAHIRELNCVRKQLSDTKGGRLAERLHRVTMLTYAISNVVEDDIGYRASDPTISDVTTYAKARSALV